MSQVEITSELVRQRLANVRVGIREDASPWALDLRPGRHLLANGTTGAGKSSLLWSIIWDLSDLIRAGWIILDALDPKVVELRPLRSTGLATVCTRIQEMPSRLEALVSGMDDRCDRMTGRDHVISLAEPARIVIVDELATLTALAPDAATRKRVDSSLGALLSRGRAAGYLVILTSVEATKEVVRWRLLCDNRICYRTSEDAGDLVFGEGSHDAGIRPRDIPREMPGVAYADGPDGIGRVRTFHITDDHIAVLASSAAGEGDDAQVISLSDRSAHLTASAGGAR